MIQISTCTTAAKLKKQTKNQARPLMLTVLGSCPSSMALAVSSGLGGGMCMSRCSVFVDRFGFNSRQQRAALQQGQHDRQKDSQHGRRHHQILPGRLPRSQKFQMVFALIEHAAWARPPEAV